MLCLFVLSSVVSEGNVLDGQKIPGASLTINTVQSSSNLNRIKFITAFLPRQYKRKRRQYFDKFSQLSLCNCKADIYEAGSLIAACVFVECSQISGPEPNFANLIALHFAKERSNYILQLPKEVYSSDCKFLCRLLEALRVPLQPAQKVMGPWVAPGRLCSPSGLFTLLCWAAGSLCPNLGKSKKELVCG